jgi:hypothetical membrane protein
LDKLGDFSLSCRGFLLHDSPPFIFVEVRPAIFVRINLWLLLIEDIVFRDFEVQVHRSLLFTRSLFAVLTGVFVSQTFEVDHFLTGLVVFIFGEAEGYLLGRSSIFANPHAPG